jgi:hypothetical protein
MVDNRVPKSERVKKHRNKTIEFNRREYEAQVRHENDIMLDKIIEINHRKRRSSPGNSVKNQTHKSLNERVRLNESQRIERENQEIAKRIVARQPAISTRELLHTFNVQRKYRKQISKVTRAKLFLPPLTQGSPRSLQPATSTHHKTETEEEERQIEAQTVEVEESSTAETAS